MQHLTVQAVSQHAVPAAVAVRRPAVLLFLLSQGVYLIGKDAGLNYWAKRLLPDAAWTSMMLKALG
jgi:hypothetical protein